MAVWLVTIERVVGVEPYELTNGSHIIGRDKSCDLVIREPSISCRHARIGVSNHGGLLLEDLKSKNGTYVGPERVTMPRRLADGDQIRLGSVVITFRVPQPPGATETSPGPGGATTGRS